MIANIQEKLVSAIIVMKDGNWQRNMFSLSTEHSHRILYCNFIQITFSHFFIFLKKLIILLQLFFGITVNYSFLWTWLLLCNSLIRISSYDIKHFGFVNSFFGLHGRLQKSLVITRACSVISTIT